MAALHPFTWRIAKVNILTEGIFEGRGFSPAPLGDGIFVCFYALVEPSPTNIKVVLASDFKIQSFRIVTGHFASQVLEDLAPLAEDDAARLNAVCSTLRI
jgi:hypothetical protein